MMAFRTSKSDVPSDARQIITDQLLKDLGAISGTGDTLLLVIGAHAASTHFDRFRTTEDVDFLMSYRGDITPVGQALSSTFPARYRWNRNDDEIEFVFPNGNVASVDIVKFSAFEPGFPVLAECRRLSNLKNAPSSEAIASVPDLLILKMDALCNAERGIKKRTDDTLDAVSFISRIRTHRLYLSPEYQKWIFRKLKTNKQAFGDQIASGLWDLIKDSYSEADELPESSDEEYEEDSDI